MRYRPSEPSGPPEAPYFTSASAVLAERLASLARGAPEERATEAKHGEVGMEVRPRRLVREQEWTWETWGQRTERVWVRLAKSIEMLNFGAIGAMLGAALGGAPAFMLDYPTYPFTVAQPLGAAVGALMGNVVVWLRWRLAKGYSELG